MSTESAFNTSLKRSRELFGYSAVPALDDIGYARRRRMQMTAGAGASDTQAQGKASTAIIVSNPQQAKRKPPPLVSTVREETDSSSALITKPSFSSNTASTTNALAIKPPSIQVPTPTWHAPWKLSTVLSSHLGWVRCIAFDPTNRLMATGAADRNIKIWSFPKASVGAEDALQWTLTGHISAIRGLEFSERHPYLFSAGEDKVRGPPGTLIPVSFSQSPHSFLKSIVYRKSNAGI